MNVGVIGLGALGLPLAVGFAVKGHVVRGYDVRPERMRDDWFKEKESGWPSTQTFQQTLLDAHIQFVPMEEVLADSDVVFVVVQTPNEDGFDGTTILTDQRRNYDLGPLNHCLAAVAEWIDHAPESTWPELSVISTLLPGTMRELHGRYFAKHTALAVAHTPMFCAMGTVLPDLFDPEWFVVGETEDYGYRRPWKILEALDSLAGVGTCRVMGWTDSEIVKTCYNAFITMKIDYANTVMEIAHKAGGDCDRVMDTLMRANARLISPRYLRGGMGDSGGCHPKEAMALSWWAREHNLSYDLFESLMKCRQEQTYWLAKLVFEAATDADVSDIWLLGTAFKPETNLEHGSSALLLADMIARYFPNRYTIHLQDPEAKYRERTSEWDHPIAAVISCKHQVYRQYRFPPGSVVVDPHRYIQDQPGVRVIRVGAP